MDWIDTILFPLKWVVAWILVIFHQFFTYLGMSPTSGWTWVLSIAGLTLVVRAALIPLFVRQIKSQRKMQLIQPDIQRLQAKYKGKKDQFSRQAMAEEQMALFRKHGTSPFASCLPILVQLPIFFSLFRVLSKTSGIASGEFEPIGGYTQALAQQSDASEIFNIALSATFMDPGVWVKVFTAILIVFMGVSQFITQRQIMTKNMSAEAMDNPIMRNQRMLLYIMPVAFAIGGIYFPLGVLIYWLVSNTWTMIQQMIVIRRMPSPGSPAEKALMERRAKKGLTPLPGAKPLEPSEEEPAPGGGQRQQPMSKSRAKAKGNVNPKRSGNPAVRAEAKQPAKKPDQKS